MKTKSSPAMTQAEFIRRYKSQKKRVIFYRILILILFFALWEAATRLGLIDPFIFSSPVRLVLAFIELIPGGKIFIHIGITLLETFISFFLVLILGLATAILLWWKRSISQVIEPYLIALNSLPKSALAPILIVWLGQ